MVTKTDQHKWGPGADAFLRANYGNSPNVAIAECLGTKASDVHQRAKQLGLI